MMRYSFEKIDTVQAYDVLLSRAQVKKQNLERKQRNLGEAIGIYRRHLDRFNQESAQVRTSLDVFTTACAALPDGKDKAGMKIKVKRLEVRQAMLEKKAYTYNVTALLVKEMKYNRLDSQILALEDYIAAVQQWRTALNNALRISPATSARRLPVAERRISRDRGAMKGIFGTHGFYNWQTIRQKITINDMAMHCVYILLLLS